MNKIIYSSAIAILMALGSCSDDDKVVDVIPADHGTVTDDQGNVYGWVRIGDLDWTTSNARNGAPMTEGQYFDNFSWEDIFTDQGKADVEENYLPVYGNLMPYDEAKESAPEGWRLPTDEDWQKLERALGMKDAYRRGWRGSAGVGTVMMSPDSGCELGIQLGGSMLRQKSWNVFIFNLDYEGEYGWYWTDTKDPDKRIQDTDVYYYRKFTPLQGGVCRESTRKENYLSVRWVRDAR